MLTLDLRHPKEGDINCAVIQKDAERIAAQPARIFRIFTRVGETRYEFVTTSKEACLGLAELSDGALQSLCIVIEQELDRAEDGQIMLVADKNTLVTRVRERCHTVFHVSQAH